MTELSIMKCMEIFSEAIPGVIIQLLSITTSRNDVTFFHWLSLASSLLSTGFVSATMSYDYDTDPAKRERHPEFYGYVPANSTKRSIVFVSLVIISSTVQLTRCMTIAALWSIGKEFLFCYLGLDIGVYLVWKLCRNDFWYWLPLQVRKNA